MSGKVYYSEGLAPTLVRGKGEGFKIAIPCMTPDRLEKDKMVDVSRIIKSQCLLSILRIAMVLSLLEIYQLALRKLVASMEVRAYLQH